MDIDKINQEYKKIMLNIPEVYKVKYAAKVVLPLQILAILKIFIEKDEKREGFKCSNDEIEGLLRNLYEDFSEKIENEKFNMTILIQVIDILKREKLVLVRLANYLNYIIFSILMGLIFAYITYFYSYKDSHE